MSASASNFRNAVERAAEILRGRRVVVLTGAGVSTESGIPDYRGPGTRRRARNPIRYNAFIGDPAARRHYWARSAVGWARMRKTEPNAAHHALARMERSGSIEGVITQNVDRLHHAAGSERVVELHGALADVRCLDCRRLEKRATYQRRLLQANPGWTERAPELAPDGDAELPVSVTASFDAPGCIRCGGALKPDVIFFGESVPKRRVEAAWALFDQADVLLVAGSSLAVYSGYRFVLRARKTGRPTVLVTLGPTRADDKVELKIEENVAMLLPALADAI